MGDPGNWADVVDNSEDTEERRRALLADYAALDRTLQNLPLTLRHDVMVPLVPGVAFAPGQIHRSNEILVSLGNDLLAWRSAAQAREILARRRVALEAEIFGRSAASAKGAASTQARPPPAAVPVAAQASQKHHGRPADKRLGEHQSDGESVTAAFREAVELHRRGDIVEIHEAVDDPAAAAAAAAARQPKPLTRPVGPVVSDADFAELDKRMRRLQALEEDHERIDAADQGAPDTSEGTRDAKPARTRARRERGSAFSGHVTEKNVEDQTAAPRSSAPKKKMSRFKAQIASKQ